MAVGSRGDVAPYTGLGVRLQEEGMRSPSPRMPCSRSWSAAEDWVSACCRSTPRRR
ncbi:hypothetical protein NKG94_03675 [Micromonospora sp. M12]